MKTIEERAKEWSDGNEAEYEEFLAFIAGAQSEHEELTRWHDPKEERPKSSAQVMIKIKPILESNHYMYATARYDGSKWLVSGIFTLNRYSGAILGWREIYE